MRIVMLDSIRQRKIIGFAVIIAVIAALMLLLKFAPEEAGGEILGELGSGSWETIGVSLPDIADMAFNAEGKIGAALSIDGELLLTRDGAQSWERTSVPIDEGDTANAVGVSEEGQIVIGVGVDESSYAAIYELKDGEWTKLEGDYGGIAGSTADGSILVGAAGLIAQKEKQGWVFNQLPSFGRRMLYGDAALCEKIVVVGDESGVFSSADKGRSWKQIRIRIVEKRAQKPAFYKAALSKDLLLVGGSNALLRSAGSSLGERWGEVRGLEAEQSVYALYIDRYSKEAFAAGGADAGGKPFILHSADEGKTWRYEIIDPSAKGRITAIARSTSGIFAATADGRILLRSSPKIAEY